VVSVTYASHRPSGESAAVAAPSGIAMSPRRAGASVPDDGTRTSCHDAADPGGSNTVSTPRPPSTNPCAWKWPGGPTTLGTERLPSAAMAARPATAPNRS